MESMDRLANKIKEVIDNGKASRTTWGIYSKGNVKIPGKGYYTAVQATDVPMKDGTGVYVQKDKYNRAIIIGG